MDQLRNLVAQDDTVIFIGSGVSRWAELPDWPALIEQLAEYLGSRGHDASLVRQEAGAGDLLQAASYAFAKLTKPQIAEFVRMATRIGSAAPASIHEAIMKLGPTCFITTNYDDLLEQAYRRWRPAPSEPRTVTNRQLVEQAEIVHAQARKFIFKPHGDARDSESIVLTREQYRMLLPDGPLSATLVTLKTLLQSRPVLFIGFGLRDPDFIYVRDLLANIYRGGMRDHYAIVADPVSEQVDYWRDNYGVHLIGYATEVEVSKSRDHGALLQLLVELGKSNGASKRAPALIDLADPAVVLGLARYAAGNLTDLPRERFPIHVASKSQSAHGHFVAIDPYDHWAVERFLIEGPARAILTGAPGAGKSFAIKNAVTELATRLQDACLQGHLTSDTIVPVTVDLKLYKGSLAEQLDERFPPQISLSRLIEEFPIKLYLDGFNEMPRTHLESGTLSRQVEELLGSYPRLSLVIGSRTSDGLEQLQLPNYELSEIPRSEVERRFSGDEVTIDPAHRSEIVSILQRPFYFGLLDRATISLGHVTSPADLYSQYIEHIRDTFASAFTPSLDLIGALERHAYKTLQQGTEAFALADLAEALDEIAPGVEAGRIEAVLNWLVSVDLLIPFIGGRGAFVHQSVTEYLAARRLADLLRPEDHAISELIAFRRWDNAIFLTLSMLNDERADLVLQQIISIDLTFAVNAARFVEHQREQVIGRLLAIIAEAPTERFDINIGHAFGRLQFERSHETLLRKIAAGRSALTGGAVTALATILGKNYKDELVELLFESQMDWPLQQSMSALSPLLDRGDIVPLIERASEWDVATLDDDSGETHNRVAALASALQGFAAEVIRAEVFSKFPQSTADERRLIAELICELHTRQRSNESLAMVVALVRQRVPRSTFPIFLTIRFEEDYQAYLVQQMDDELLFSIIAYIEGGDAWAVELLRTVCANHPTVAERVRMRAGQASGQMRPVLDYCSTGDEEPLFDWLNGIANSPGGRFDLEFFQQIDFTELNWNGRNDLFVKLLRRRDPTIAALILGGAIPVEISGLDEIDIGTIAPWLEWLLELIGEQEGEQARQRWWLSHQLAFLIARSSGPAAKAELLSHLNTGEPALRWAIVTMVLPHVEGWSIDDVAEESISFMLDTLRHQSFTHQFRPHVLTLLATESFVSERLLPLAAEGNDTLRRNVEWIAGEAGKRLGRRFALPVQASH